MSPLIVTPVSSHIEPACEAALQALEKRGYEVWRVRGHSAIDQGRSQMATDALAAGYRETMWIDADIAFEPDDVDRIRTLGLAASPPRKLAGACKRRAIGCGVGHAQKLRAARQSFW